MKTYLAIKWVDGGWMDGWLGGSFMYVFHTNQIWDSIKDQSNCGLYIWTVFMNICFQFKVWPFLFCYRFDLIGPCWPEVSIPSLDFYVTLGKNIVWVLKAKSV